MIQPKYGILMQRDQEEVSLSQELAQMLETFLPRDAQRDDGKRTIKSFFFEQRKGRETE